MSDEQQVTEILENTRTIAMVGASNKPERASYRVMAFLQMCGYEVIPVNPLLAGEELHGQTVLAQLSEIEGPIDLVDIFRNSEAAVDAVDQAIALGAKAVWMQLGVINPVARQKAQDAGLQVVMDRCPKIDIPEFGITVPASVRAKETSV